MNVRDRLQAAHGQYERGIYRVVNAAILAGIFLFTPEELLGIRAVTKWNLLVLCAVLALFAGMNFLGARGRILCLMTAAISLAVTVGVIGMRTSLAFVQAYFQWSMGKKIEQTEWLVGCQLLQTAIMAAASYAAQILLEKFRALKIGLACLCAMVMLFCLFAPMSLTHMGVVFMLMYMIVAYVEWLQDHWKKTRSGSLKEQMIWLAPFLAVYLLLMSVMPAPETPYQWQWVKNLYYQFKESFLVVTQNLLRGGREDFGVALSGFSEDAALGGGFRDNSREVMNLQGQSSLVTNAYLIGKVYDTFDGKQWLQKYDDDDEDRFIDTLETLYAVRRLDDKYLPDYLNKTDLRIRYEFFNTKYVFAPLKTETIKSIGSDLNYSSKGGVLQLKKQRGYGTEYNVTYYQLNVGQELFGRLLEAQQEPDEKLWDAIAKEHEKEIGQKVTLEMVQAHRQSVYDHYLGEVTLSGEVEHYLSEITKDARTDVEKLQAIEKELSSFAYTRQPGNMPDRITNAGEFLDYFLLESREGYCTYFATAFVLLARAEGFPARYAQGFCVPVEQGGAVTVLSNMAHSWPEVYMEGVGWIPFEPTPGYGGLRYTPWRVKNRDSIIINEEDEDLDDEEEEDAQASTVVKPEEVTDTGEAEAMNRLRKLLGIGIPAILAGYALVLLVDNGLGRRRYRKMSPEERLKAEVRRNLWILSWIGLIRGERETMQELHTRGERIPGFTALRFIEDYEDVVYGGKNAGEAMIEGVKKERELLLGLVRREKKWAYAYYKLRLFLVRYR